MSNNFLSQNNAQLLWEVLLEDPNVNKANPQIINKFMEVFKTNLFTFYNTDKNRTNDLVNMNKSFLKSIIPVFNKYSQTNQPQQEFKKIKIGEDIQDFYKIEDIRDQRQNNFEKELSLKINDFENLIKPKMPPPIDFSDKKEDEKINNINLLIEETIAKRNYDIQQIQNSMMNTGDKSEDWLKSQNTSIKADKMQFDDVREKKTLTWDEDNIRNINNDKFYDNNQNIASNSKYQNQEESIFFSKLKKIPNNEVVSDVETEQIKLLKELHEKIDNMKIDFENKLNIILNYIENQSQHTNSDI